MYSEPGRSVHPDVYSMGMHPWRTPVGIRRGREVALHWVGEKSARLDIPSPEHLVRQIIVDALTVGTDVYVIGGGVELDIFGDALGATHRASTTKEAVAVLRRALSTRHGLPVLLVIIGMPEVSGELSTRLEQYASAHDALDLRLVTCGPTIPGVDELITRRVSLREPGGEGTVDVAYSISDADIVEALETSPASIRAAARRG